MGMFDTIIVGERNGQVKIWVNRMIDYLLGSVVPEHDGFVNYDIAMREGGFVHVRDCQIAGWDDQQSEAAVVCFDKWGNHWFSSEMNVGEVEEVLQVLTNAKSAYFFKP